MTRTPRSTVAAKSRERQLQRMREQAECLAQLAWGPKSASQLAEATGLRLAGVYDLLMILQHAGMVYPAGTGAPCGRGRPATLFSLQPWPHARDGRPCPVSAPPARPLP